MRVLDAAQMRAADRAACARTSDVELMRRAGAAIAALLRARVPHARRIVAFAGPGNNGGDAFAALAELDDVSERVVYTQPAPQPSAARADAEARARAVGVGVLPFPANEAAARAALAGADVALDGMLGTGAHPPLSLAFRAVAAALGASDAQTIALDVPTGVDASTGAVDASGVRAACTVVLGAYKIGLFLDPARACVGDLVLGDLGIDAEVADVPGPRRAVLTDVEFAALRPRRGAASDKRSAGAPLLLAGSARYPGAAILCTRGAARAGAGYVTVATPPGAEPALRAHLVEQVVVGLDPERSDESRSELDRLLPHVGALGIGPGLALDAATGALVRELIARSDLPLVLDASGFAHVADSLDALRGKRCVLTPHDGEFVRLDGGEPLEPQTRVARLRAFVARTGITTLLKGATTLIDDGETLHVNPTGTSALATAGTGDVLTGVIATLLAQGLAPVDAARVGAYWHGLAGRRAGAERPVGVVAGDVAEALPFVLT